jgi:hypothetical protein
MENICYNVRSNSTKLMLRRAESNMIDILLVFIALKWTGAVDWSWAVVFIPLWLELIEDIGLGLFCWCFDIDL